MAIEILVTGGTFDKEYNELNGTLFFKETHLPEMLNIARCKLGVKIKTVMLVDSLEMTDGDRELILSHCKKSGEDRIVITHGTDKMAETAQILGKNIKNKTIVLTGAMIPYVFGSSDGLFNLGCAVAFVQSMPHGVYVTMNGKCFSWNNVRKIRELGEFRSLK